jgi:membrane fusion protein (multidrug efflux system)
MDQPSPAATMRPQAAAPQRSLKPFLILAAILLLFAAAGFGYWLMNRGFATTDDAEIDGDLYQVAPQISGRVAQVLVADNQHVSAGQVLVVLDDRDQQVAVAKAQAGVTQAQANLAVAQANAAGAVAEVVQAQADLAHAQQDFNRYSTVNPKAITQQTLDAATATIAGARAKFTSMQRQADSAAASVGAAQASLQAAQVAAKDAQLQLSYTSITAPAAGHISEKVVEPGGVVAPGTALLSVVGDEVWVTANYKETQLVDIHPGETATIAVDAVPGVTFKAHVDSIQYGTGAVFSLLPAQNATGNYVKIIQRVPVKLLFDDPRVQNYLLAPGMSVTPSITIAP